VVVTSFARDPGRALGIVVALAMAVVLVSAPASFGAGDPVASGTLKLKLSKSFKKQLKQNGVKMTPKKGKFTITPSPTSTLDPATGSAQLSLNGKLTFKKGSKKLVYKKLTATIGSKGNLKGSKGKVFKLKGGSVTRQGFGAGVSGVKVSLLGKAAKKINKKLGLHSLHKGKAGTATATEQPQTVVVTGGSASVVLSPPPPPPGTPSSSSVLSKLQFHCINATPGAGGLDLIAPATHPNPLNPLLSAFPVVGGTIGPTGTAGVVDETGGVKFTKNITGPNGLGQTCAAGSQTVEQTNSGVNLGLSNIQAHVVVAGTGTVLDGDKGQVIVSDLDTSGRTFAADATNHTISMNGDLIKLSAISATTLNQVFPQGTPANPAAEFAAGDVFGTSGRTVTTR
jgi:hypothetical protein